MKIVPITFKTAAAYVARLHRHNRPPVGHKFSVGVECDGALVGVAMAGRPIARALDDGRTLEINRSCTDGTANANSMLYGAVRRAAAAMGYERLVTYTQADESGASLRGAGFRRVKELPPRKSWADSSVRRRAAQDPEGPGNIARVFWMWP